MQLTSLLFFWVWCLTPRLWIRSTTCSAAAVDADADAVSAIECLIVVVETMYYEDTLDQEEQGSSSSSRSIADGEYDYSDAAQEPELSETHCIPMQNNRETSRMYSIELPDWLGISENQLRSGKLRIRLSNATVENNHKLVVNAFTEFTVLPLPVFEDPLPVVKGTTVDDSPTTTTKTAAVVRISTLDSFPTPTVADLANLLDQDQTNFVSQYYACSNGKLRIDGAGVYDVVLDQNTSSYVSVSVMVSDATEAILEQAAVEQPTDVADFVLFCVPPGSPGDWVARADSNSWRTWYNDSWCTSLSATMHELAHNMGLPHSNENGRTRGDTTGYLGVSQRFVDFPLRCFNGLKHHQFGWYAENEIRVDPSLDGPKLVHLAAFADIHHTEETVLINVADTYFVQYNFAKGMNIGTGEKKNQVTVTVKTSQGSDLVGALSAGDVFSNELEQEEITIAACETRVGNNGEDIMVTSIARGLEDICHLYDPLSIPSPSPSTTPSGQPSSTPSSGPTVSLQRCLLFGSSLALVTAISRIE